MLTKTVVYFLLDRALMLIKIKHAANFVETKIKTVLSCITPAPSSPGFCENYFVSQQVPEAVIYPGF